ncbi:MAG TPA: tetratricopeptide repeat protein [Gemmataceae bacterium]|nr:tetratricopeptide repeat protein [Gemmataceae bacterium]
MLSRTTGLRLALTVAALALAGLTRAADDDKALRQQVLALNQITGDAPMRGEILTLVEDKANTPKLLALAVKMAGEKDQPLNFNAAYVLARTSQLLKDSDAARTMYRVCIDQAKKVASPTKLFDAYRGLIADYYVAGKYDDARKLCQEFLDLPQLKPSGPDDLETSKYNSTLRRAQELIRREQIQILVRQGKIDDATKVIDERLAKDPDDMEAMEDRALVQREAGNYAAAAKTYEEMIKKVTDAIDKVKNNTEASKEVKDAFIKQFSADVRDYRYILSGLYIDAKDVAKASEQLKILLKEEPDNPSYNNDLGYVWADHDMNLAEAEKLIRKAIEDDKKEKAKKNPQLKPEQVKANASYLDSLGWVLYKGKKYKDALPPLLDAVKEEDGQNIEIYDHLAEVHLALGDKAAALEAWKKGLDAAKKRLEEVGPNKREEEKKVEVEKKIKAQQK